MKCSNSTMACPLAVPCAKKCAFMTPNGDRLTGLPRKWTHPDDPDGATMNDIGWAVKQMHDGQKVRRAGWNGKGMFVVLMPALYLPPYNSGDARKVNDRTAKHIGEDAPLDCQPYIAMYTALKQWQPGWLCSQADLLAIDWEIAV